MDKYDELIKRLRRCEQFRCRECEYEQVMGCRAKLNEEAADAIEAQDRRILTIQHEMMAEAESHIAEVNRLNKQIEELQADVQPVVRASWKRIDYKPCGHDYECSLCRWKNDMATKYCPNCGAMMEES